MTLNSEESEAFNELQERVNELAERLEIVETAGRSLFDILPFWIQKRVAEWSHPKYSAPLKLIFDATPMNKVWAPNERPTQNRFTGYHRASPDSNGEQNEFRESS